MKISDITRYLETLSPLSLQEDYDNCGLLLGDPDTEFHQALLCLDLTNEVMAEAVSKKCNLVISHHPFIFKGLKKLTPSQPETLVIISAIKHNIAIYAIHTNLDNTLHGLNALVLSKLGISRYRILSPKTGLLAKLAVFCPVDHTGKVRHALFNAGAGHIGEYDCCSFNLDGEGTFRASDRANPFVGEKNNIHVENETRIEVIFPRYLENRIISALIAAHPYEEVAYDIYALHNKLPRAGAGLIGELDVPCGETEFLELVKQKLDIPVIRHSPLILSPVRLVALCTGSGSFLIQEAIRSQADVFLTADLKYHDFFGLDNRMLLADIGHYESEQGVKEWLHDALIEKFPNFAFLISEVNTNPVHYL
ncbi:MAG: Nif3-like dinuclear metal center hexameric protein [Bacteroidales bacterium]|nr:Nif3-like dinuclear metal center hexameric protein [Bacteroidales bacterium]